MASSAHACALCTAFALAFAALDRDRASTSPRLHLERVRRLLETARRDHAPEHHMVLSAALEDHNDEYAVWLTGLATEINAHHDASTAERTTTS